MILTALIGATTVSGLFGIMQYHDMPFAWDIHDLLVSFVKTEQLEESLNMARLYGNLVRPMGLAWTTIDLAYHLVCAIGVAFPIAVLADIPRSTRLLLSGALIILLVATIESLTRSAIVGMALVITVTLWIQATRSPTGRGRRPWIIVAVAAITIILSFRTLGPSSQAERVYSFADDTRTSLYLGSLRLIAWNPLGIGTGNRESVVREYQSELNDLPNPTALLDFAPHNGFLLTTLNWGLPAFALCIAFISIMLKEAKRLRTIAHHLPPPFSWVGYILPLFMLGYLPNALFHNGFPLNGDMVFWYYFGTFAGISSVLQATIPSPAPKPEHQTQNLRQKSPITTTSKGTPLTP